MISHPGKHSFRVVAVNGVTQLISAVAALQEHRKLVPGANLLSDVLAINVLETQNLERAESMSRLIRQCAPLLHDWSAIVDFSTTTALANSNVDTPSEIFVNLLEVPENKRLFNHWPAAKRVLYGDGLGINAALQDFLPDATWSTCFRRLLSCFISSIQVPYSMPSKEPCDYGYYLINDPDSTVQSTTTRLLEPRIYRQLFDRLSRNLQSSALNQCLENLPANQTCDVLLMTNLFPPPISNQDAEVEGYSALLTNQARNRPEAIVVKPHPRHHSTLLSKLETALQPLYKTVFMIKDHDSAVLPFEILLLRAFQSGILNSNACQMFATSTAAYSIPVVFGLPVQIGFGKKSCSSIFPDPAWRSSRIRHESKLQANVDSLLQRTQLEQSSRPLN